ncbi:MAG: DUF4258 domain-containing protein [Acidobacteriota bacterium]
MTEAQELLAGIKKLLKSRKFRVRIHAARHLIEEGFTEQNILDAVLGKSKVLEYYREEARCLVVGYFRLSKKVTCPLHVVCDYSNSEVVDIVTAYIPDIPWWQTPTKRGQK